MSDEYFDEFPEDLCDGECDLCDNVECEFYIDPDDDEVEYD